MEGAIDMPRTGSNEQKGFLPYESRQRVARLSSKRMPSPHHPPPKPVFDHRMALKASFLSPISERPADYAAASAAVQPTAGGTYETPICGANMNVLIERIEKVFVEVLDEDQDGNVSFGEFTKAMEQLCPGFSGKQLHKLFDYMDVDGSGTLTFDEIANVVSGTILRHPEITDPGTLLKFSMMDFEKNRQRHGQIDNKTGLMLDALQTEVNNSVQFLKQTLRIHDEVFQGKLESVADRRADQMEFLMNFVPRMGSNEQRHQMRQIHESLSQEKEMMLRCAGALSKNLNHEKSKVESLEQKLKLQELLHENEKLNMKVERMITCVAPCNIL